MKATLVMRDERLMEEGLWTEIVIWQVPIAVRGSSHPYKYRLALIDRDFCVLRYDNEAGKGDHKHIGADEFDYTFSTIPSLLSDFGRDAMAYQQRRRR